MGRVPATSLRGLLGLVLALGVQGALSGCEPLRPACARDADCQLPLLCGGDGRCVAPAPRADREPCQDDLHCQGAVCLFAPEGGRCATGCEDPAGCPSGRCALATDARASGDRLRLVCGPAQGDRFFGERCATDSQCRPGLCHQGHCTSACGACPTDFACQPATLARSPLSLDHGVCSWWPVQPVLELGEVPTPAAAPALLSLELPPGYGAFTLVLEDFDGLVPAVTRLTGPDGTVFIGAARQSDGGSADLARGSSAPGTATALVPGSELARAALVPGRYVLEVVTYAAAGYPLSPQRADGRIERAAAVLERPAPGGLVDLSLHLAPEVGYSVADGGGTWVRTVLDTFDQVARAKLGVALGEVRLELLPPDAGARVSSAAEARALMAAHARGEPTARLVNVMVVQSLSFAGGFSGGLPGAPGVYLRPGAGVAVEPLASGPASTGVLVAHEVLHYLGLFHTSDEFVGPDLVSDTPSCANPAVAGCPDARNLLFPYFPTREPLELTEGQARVLAGSPWLYQRLHPGACGAHDVVGLAPARYASGSTLGAPAVLSGSCGGAGGERVHLLRLDAPAARLEVSARGTGFRPVVYLRRAECDGRGEERACVVSDGGTVVASAADAGAGAWFVVVDSQGDGGRYVVDVTVTP